MRRLLIMLLALTACTDGTNPFSMTLASPAAMAADREKRARVEVFVKSNHPALMREIIAGDGPTLQQAMGLAAIPAADRPARLIQLRADAGLYQSAPAALVTALMLYGA